ncbi:glutamate racemase [Balneolaceae bacterium ANBcel3]|nr:glutamate racemase [Balneolaceae bacterium ANBcel3]
MSKKEAPIGIFDSGIGGLTVVKAVRKSLPSEHIIYFGDTARVPYGIKSTDTIREYALQITHFLIGKKVKAILVACNSVASAAQHEIKELCREHDIPVLDVIEAGTKAALAVNKPVNNVGVIGTLATIGSGAYENALMANGNKTLVFSRPCPLLVPLAEEGWTDNAIAIETLKIYLSDFKDKELDSLILGCTHYPLFKESIKKVLGDAPEIIDSAESIAEMTVDMLRQKGWANPTGEGRFDCFVSDKPQRFKVLAERFLGEKLNRVEIINLKS